jgi:hypothetical protein
MAVLPGEISRRVTWTRMMRTDVNIAFTHAMLGQSTRPYRASIALDLGHQSRLTGPP